MATGKRFYWMKLKESFMTSDTIDYFMSQPDGANYVVLYQMLCLKTINTDGRLSRQITTILLGARQTGAKRSAGNVIPRRSKVWTMSPLMSPQLSPQR